MESRIISIGGFTAYHWKQCESFEALLYIGSREGYHGKSFNKENMIKEINLFQESSSIVISVRISDCTFTMKDYLENGWEISCITYPNRWVPRDQIVNFMRELMVHLCEKFKQNRMTLRFVDSPYQTLMIEDDNAETTHKPN